MMQDTFGVLLIEFFFKCRQHVKKLGVSHCGSGSSMEIGNFHLLDSLVSSTNGRRHTCRKAWTEEQMEKALQAVNEMTVREAATHAVWCA